MVKLVLSGGIYIKSKFIKNSFILILFIFSGCGYISENTNLYKEDAIDSNIYYSTPISISQEEFIKAYATNNNILFEEAHIFLKEQSEEVLFNLTKNYNLELKEEYLLWKRKDFIFTYPRNPNFKASLILYYEVLELDSFKQVNYAFVTSEYVDGLYNANWVPLSSMANAVNNNNTPGSFPTERLSLMASGYFELNIPISLGRNFKIDGFNISQISEDKIFFISEPFLMQYQYKRT